MWQDLKLALRNLRARPGFTAVVLVTVALGVGANTAIFSVVDAVVLRPLPYRSPEQLALIFPTNPRDGGRDRLARFAEVEILRRRLSSFTALAAATTSWQALLTDDAGDSSPIQASWMSANLPEVLGVAPTLGRMFRPEEDVDGGPRLALLSHRAWLRRFGGDPSVVGRTIVVNGGGARVVGVMPAAMSFPDPGCEVWLPLGQSYARRWRFLMILGRLREGATGAGAELATAARALEEAFPDSDAGVGLRLTSLQVEQTKSARPILLLLLGTVALVLIVACTNVANLMLARGVTRMGELAVRSALGASARRLVQQLLVEGLVLALAGGALGALLSRWLVALALDRSPVPWPSPYSAALDARVLIFTLVVSALTGAFFSLIPAWRLLRVDPQQALRGQGRNTTDGPAHRRTSRALVIAQMALAMMLLTGAGLLTRTVQRLLATDPGFAAASALTLRVHLPPGERDPASQLALNREVETQLRQLPGVTAVGQISRLPFGPGPNVLHTLEIQRRPLPPGQLPAIDVRNATPDYFQAMGIPLLKGRGFTEIDADADVAVVNEAAARRFWPAEDPVGHLVRTGDSAGSFTRWQRIVGVIGNVRHTSLEADPRPELYYYASVGDRTQFVLRAPAPALLVPALRAAVQRVDRRLAVTNVETLSGLIDQSTSPRRFATLLLASFAALALALAALGLFGVMSYTIARRRKEIGVRLALGAPQSGVALMLVKEGMWMVAIGGLVGLAGAVVLSRLMSSLLYQTSPVDPLAFSTATAVLAVVSLAACALAARRAMKVEPMIALREG